MVVIAQRLLSLGALALLGWGLVANAGAAPPPTLRLAQGWTSAQEESFYYTTQGTVIAPASWLGALKNPDGTPFMSPAHMRSFGFIVDDLTSASNPNHWPVGFAVDDGVKSGGVATVGFTCAACHTSELSYRGRTLRVDGGQANINVDAFKKSFSDALLATGNDATRRADFEQRAVELGFPKDKIEGAFAARFRDLQQSSPARAAYAAKATAAGVGRNDALAAIAVTVFNSDLGVPSNTNSATAPVNYPYLWNVGNLYWVQYNASVHQPMARNIGEALGVGALTNFVDPATGQLNPEPMRWRTSIPIGNLFALETLIDSLKPPRWPVDVFGPLDRAKVAAGRTLFGQNCAACHGVRAIGSAGAHDWSVKVLPLDKIGTDPRQAANFRDDTYDATKLGLSAHTTAGVGLQVVTGAIRTQAYKDAAIPPAQWGTYDGSDRKNVLTEPCGYKARPLVGVWSTPPFLHNGSVPTIFELLSETRPATFRSGSTEYDPKHLGFVDASVPGATTLDTSLTGNSNAGHWFTNDRSRKGRIGRHFSDAEKYQLLEYLKAATYADYPHTVVQHPDPEPCVDASAAYPTK